MSSSISSLKKNTSNKDLDNNVEQGLRGFVLLISVINFLTKLVLSLSFWILRIKINRGESEPLNPL
jgi:hypothetical protein